MKALTDEQLQAKTPEFKERLANGDLTVAVRPVSSLGTKGKAIGTTFRV